MIKKIGDRIGKMMDVNGTDPIDKMVSPTMPKKSKMEYTVFTYAAMVPITISIHATSLVLDHSIIAKNEASAPTKSWLEI